MRYAKIFSEIERFERWGKTRKLKVRNAVEEEMDGLKMKELGAQEGRFWTLLRCISIFFCKSGE